MTLPHGVKNARNVWRVYIAVLSKPFNMEIKQKKEGGILILIFKSIMSVIYRQGHKSGN